MHKFIAGFFFVGTVFAQDSIQQITKTLCSPEFHGRGYVNRGDSLAADYIATSFKQRGLQAIGSDFLQSFPLDVNTFPDRMEVAHSGRVLIPGVHFMVHPSSGGFTGELNCVKMMTEDLLDADRSKEKLSLIAAGEFNAVLIDISDAKGDTLKLLRGVAMELANYYPVIKVSKEKFTWSVGREQLPHVLVDVQDSVLTDELQFSLDISAKFIPNYQSNNVIAKLPSSKKCRKRETILITAHYDHLGRMGSETYFPGANDNASGTAMLLTLADYFRKNPVDYDLVFVAFGGEEAGLVGSNYFVEHPLVPLNKIRFVLNLDIMGSGEEGITIVNATLHDEEFQLLQTINTEHKLLTQIKSRGPAANSDHYWFTQKGVPAFFMYTMGPNKNYHDVFDRYEALSFSEYADITELIARFIENLN